MVDLPSATHLNPAIVEIPHGTVPADMHHVRLGRGKPLLLIHGIGGSWQSWGTILAPLASARNVWAVDLPGFGQSPPLVGETSVPTLADAIETFLGRQGLTGVDIVGASMGARLVLELARRGSVGSVVSLDPGGFWSGWQRDVFHASVAASIRIIRVLQPVMPALTGTAAGRSVLFAQFSPRPWDLSPKATLTEMRSFAASPVFDETLRSLAFGPVQQGAAGLKSRIVIGWGRSDKVCLPSQSTRALDLFPDARLHWFERSGHFPHWDEPARTVRLILSATA